MSSEANKLIRCSFEVALAIVREETGPGDLADRIEAKLREILTKYQIETDKAKLA
jgi:hypothetical protein